MREIWNGLIFGAGLAFASVGCVGVVALAGAVSNASGFGRMGATAMYLGSMGMWIGFCLGVLSYLMSDDK